VMPHRALLNDINPHLINFYRWLKRGLRVDDIDLANTRATFYAHRARFNALVGNGGGRSREAAALFYYLNRTGYNGLCRFNSPGEVNLPFGPYARTAHTPDFNRHLEMLAPWEFDAGDFEHVPLGADDFVYADPPYDVPFTKYAKEGFAWRDQERAAEWLASHRGPVVLVNQATDRICRLYERLAFDLDF